MIKNKFFVLLVVSSCCSMLALIAYFNYVYDNYGFFKQNNSVLFAAKSISKGEAIAGLVNYDERLFQKLVVENFVTYPDTLIIGSSRSMMISSKMINGSEKTFNHSVSGASLEDYIAIVGLYSQKKALPKKIIFGIDPWIFNKNNSENRWQSLLYEYDFMISQISKKNPILTTKNDNRYFQLINFENTKNNFLHMNESSQIHIIQDENIDSSLKRADGSIAYPFSIRFQNDVETKLLVQHYISEKNQSLDSFYTLSNTNLFEDFIHYLRDKGVVVEFFLPPFHPSVYAFFRNNCQYANILKSEEYLKSFAEKNNIILYGSYDPNIFGFTSNDFTDGAHSKENVSFIIFKNFIK